MASNNLEFPCSGAYSTNFFTIVNLVIELKGHNDTKHQGITSNILHNDPQHKGIISDIQHNDTQHNDPQHKGIKAAISITTFCIMILSIKGL